MNLSCRVIQLLLSPVSGSPCSLSKSLSCLAFKTVYEALGRGSSSSRLTPLQKENCREAELLTERAKIHTDFSFPFPLPLIPSILDHSDFLERRSCDVLTSEDMGD